MTSPSLRKLPTTAPAPTTPPATGRNLGRAFRLALMLVPVAVGVLFAQGPGMPQPVWKPAPQPVIQPVRADLPIPVPPRFPVPGQPVARTAQPEQPKDEPGQPLIRVRQEDSKNPEDRSPISLDIPGPETVFGHLDTELALQQRMRQARTPGEGPITFPDDVVVSKEPYAGRNWPRTYCYVEPNYLVHNRLYFQELNGERYGWDLGPLSPVVSSLYFARDMALFPYRWGSDFFRSHDANTGYCLPGDPVPYYLYPVDLNLGGGAIETAAVITLLAVFP